MRRYQVGVLAVAALAGTLGTGCRGGGGLPSREKEIELGRKFAEDYESKLPDGPLVTRGPEYDRVMRVAKRIIPLAKKDWDVPYNVKVVDSDQINAFAVPGGPIYFYTGLVKLTASDDEVASVMGHELSHVTKRHSVRQMQKSQEMGLLLSLGDALIRGGNSLKSAAAAGALISQQKFSQKDESQADEFGFGYLVKAGYKPDAMADFFTKMQSKNADPKDPISKTLSGFISSHPLTSKRIEASRKRAEDYRKGMNKTP